MYRAHCENSEPSKSYFRSCAASCSALIAFSPCANGLPGASRSRQKLAVTATSSTTKSEKMRRTIKVNIQPPGIGVEGLRPGKPIVRRPEMVGGMKSGTKNVTQAFQPVRPPAQARKPVSLSLWLRLLFHFSSHPEKVHLPSTGTFA